jgi:hypothetical protein
MSTAIIVLASVGILAMFGYMIIEFTKKTDKKA